MPFRCAAQGAIRGTNRRDYSQSMSNEESPSEQPSERPEVTSQPRHRGFRTGRLEAFSDGVSFLPFPTRLVAEYIHTDNAERVAVTFYGIVLVLATTMLLVL